MDSEKPLCFTGNSEPLILPKQTNKTLVISLFFIVLSLFQGIADALQNVAKRVNRIKHVATVYWRGYADLDGACDDGFNPWTHLEIE